MNCDQRTALQGIRHYTDRVTRTGMHGIRDMHEIHAIQQTHANRKATAYRSVVDHIPSPQPAAPYLAVSVTLHHPYSVAALNQLRHLAHNHSSTTGGSSSRLSTVGHWSANPAPCNSASTYGNRESRIVAQPFQATLMTLGTSFGLQRNDCAITCKDEINFSCTVRIRPVHRCDAGGH